MLKLLGRSKYPLGVNAIARALKVVPSSCLHILRALAAEGLVKADPWSQYTSPDKGCDWVKHQGTYQK